MSAVRSWKLVVAGFAAAVVIAGGVGMTVLQLRAGDANEPGPPNIDTLDWVTERGEEGWLVRHPRTWIYSPFRDLAGDRLKRAGASVSNRPYPFPRGLAGLGGQPPVDSLAAVQFAHSLDEPPPKRKPGRDSTFPLVLEQAGRVRDVEGGVLLRMPVTVGGDAGWLIEAWIGDRVDELDAEIVRRIFSSFGVEKSASPGALTLEEQMIAHEIAESYRGARTVLKGRPHSHEEFAAKVTAPAPCDTHTCALVVFKITGGLRFRVVVDLTEKRAISFS